jgi:hypothetical protein
MQLAMHMNNPWLKTFKQNFCFFFADINLHLTFASWLWFLVLKAKRESGENPEQLPLL